MTQALPEPLVATTAPRFFTPSSWLRLESCALSVLANDEQGLPETLASIVGRVFHRARERIVEELPSESAARTDFVRRMVHEERLEEELSLKDAGEVAVLPLEENFGRRRWLELRLELEAFAKTLDGPRPRRKFQGGTAPDTDTFSLGTERWCVSTALRLRGRPDEARAVSDNVVEIVDYKTGNAVDPEGNVAPSAATQVQLYLLMTERLTGRDVRGRVHARRAGDVRWGAREREELEGRVAKVAARFPEDALVPAADAAAPGVICNGCHLRPRCATYLATAPTLWNDREENPRPLPPDAWGTLLEVIRNDDGLRTAKIRDPSGRLVLIRGLVSEHDLPIGERVYFFDLVSTEDAVMHGRRLHPRAFHERSPGGRWDDARRLRVFRA